jgi:hypothetical protein
VDGCRDHRIVMAAAIASIACRESVTILGADAVNKSYPNSLKICAFGRKLACRLNWETASASAYSASRTDAPSA